MDLVELIKTQLGGNNTSMLARFLNTTPDETSRAVDAGVPALLAGLMGTASTPEGARTLAHAVNNADEGIMGKLGGLLGSGAGAQSARGLIDKGGGLLNTLFGGSSTSGIYSAISRFTGLGSGSVASLMGLLAPIAMSALRGRAATSAGFDPSSISNLLAGQRDNIARAMPPGLGDALSSIPGFGWNSGARQATAVDRDSGYVPGRRESVGNAVKHTRYPAAEATAKRAWWLVPLAALLAIGGIIWYFASRPAPRRPVLGTTEARAPLDLTTGATSLTSSMSATIAGWRNADDVNRDVPRIREWTARLDDHHAALNNLTQSGRDSVRAAFRDTTPRIVSGIESALNFPGLTSEARGLLNELTERLRSVAGL